MGFDRKPVSRHEAVDLPPAIAAQLVRSKGRPAIDPVYHKRPVSIRLDQMVIDHFKAEGAGWQTRLNEFLLKSIVNADRVASTALESAMAAQAGFAVADRMKE